MMSYSETPKRVRELLLYSGEPLYHEDIAERLRCRESYVKQALMELYDEDKVDWPAPTEWVALPDDVRKVEGTNTTIHIGVVNHE